MTTFGDTSSTASDAGLLDAGPGGSDVLLLGAAGSSGRLIAAELAVRGLSLRLAGRRLRPLEDLAHGLAVHGATIDLRSVDVSHAARPADAIAGVGVVLSTIGP